MVAVTAIQTSKLQSDFKLARMIVSLEVRERLAVAVLCIKDSLFSWQKPLKIYLEERCICLQDEELQELKIYWPEEQPALDPNFCHFSLLQTAKESDLMIRINLRPCGKIELAKMNYREEGCLKNWSSCLTWPKCVVPKINGGQNWKIYCTNCEEIISQKDFLVSRCLPLPSIAWRDFSQDWFCGCSHGGNAQPQAGLQNKELASQVLEPKFGDILYAPGFVCLNFRSVNDEKITKLDNAQVVCTACGTNIGSYNGIMFQLWQHSVIISPKQDKGILTAGETFGDLLNGILSESPEKSIKVYFSSTPKVLLVWILDQEISFYANDIKFCDKQMLVYLDVKKMTKVMFKEVSFASAEQSDVTSQTFQVNHGIIEGALTSLRHGQNWTLGGAHDKSLDLQLSYLPK